MSSLLDKYLTEKHGAAYDPNTGTVNNVEPSILNSAGYGVLNGASFGAAPKISGTVADPIGAAKSLLSLLGANYDNSDSNVAAYDNAKGVTSANIARAQKANPKTFFAGNLAGGIIPGLAISAATGGIGAGAAVGGLAEAAGEATPLIQAASEAAPVAAQGASKASQILSKYRSLANVGAKVGAAQGFVSSDADTLGGKIKDGANGLIEGAITAPIVGGAMSLGGKALSALTPSKLQGSISAGDEGIPLLTEKQSKTYIEKNRNDGSKELTGILNKLEDKLGDGYEQNRQGVGKSSVEAKNLLDELEKLGGSKFNPDDPLQTTDMNNYKTLISNYKKRLRSPPRDEAVNLVPNALQSAEESASPTLETPPVANVASPSVEEAVAPKEASPVAPTAEDAVKTGNQNSALPGLESFIKAGGYKGLSSIPETPRMLPDPNIGTANSNPISLETFLSGGGYSGKLPVEPSKPSLLPDYKSVNGSGTPASLDTFLAGGGYGGIKPTHLTANEISQLKGTLSKYSNLGSNSMSSQDGANISSLATELTDNYLKSKFNDYVNTDKNFHTFQQGVLDQLKLKGLNDADKIKQLSSQLFDEGGIGKTAGNATTALNNATEALKTIDPNVANQFNDVYQKASHNIQVGKAAQNLTSFHSGNMIHNAYALANKAGNFGGLVSHTITKLPTNQLVKFGQSQIASGNTSLGNALVNAAQRDVVGKNAIIFTLMQNPAYRSILNSYFEDADNTSTNGSGQ